MRYLIYCVAVLVFSFSLSVAAAQDKVVVIPLNSVKKLNNVVTVSAKGGDFTDPVAAVNSISGATADNPYLVLIGPGVYTLTQTLIMKPFVTIAGSGREVTTIKGAISSSAVATSTMIKGADNATLRDLTVENTGGSSVSIVLYNDNDSPVIYNASFIASGGVVGNVGVMNINASSPTMTNMTVEASGGSECYGLSNNSSSVAFITSGKLRAYGGTENYAVRNAGTSAISIEHSIISGLQPISDPDGIYYAIKVDNSDGFVKIGHSSVLGSVSSAGLLVCLQSDNGHLNELTIHCVFP